MSKNMPWLTVGIAAAFEVGWVIGLKHANHLWEWMATIAAILISFYLMITVSRYLPVGTVYAVFVGLGTAGTVSADILWFGAEVHGWKIAFMGLLLIGVIGLKLLGNNMGKESGG